METIDIENLVENKIKLNYPCILIDNPNRTLPLMVRNLEEGDMQLIVEFNGKTKVVKKMSRSALNVDKLIRTNGTLKYVISKDIIIPINSITDYLSCLV